MSDSPTLTVTGPAGEDATTPTIMGTSTPPPQFFRQPSVMTWTSPDQKQHFWVINPMHIVTLGKARTFAERMAERIKAISEMWFTHVLLILVLMGYVALGALLFSWVEAPLEIRQKESIVDMRYAIVQQLWEARWKDVPVAKWETLMHQRLKEYEAQIFEAYSYGIVTDTEKTDWTFWGAMFYCGTVVTTIGYGNIAPQTTAGRAATIIYSFIGIPLLLMVLADLGTLFTRAIKRIYRILRYFYSTGQCRRVRKVGRRATALPYMVVGWGGAKQNKPQESSPTATQKDVEAGVEKKEDKKGEEKKSDDETKNEKTDVKVKSPDDDKDEGKKLVTSYEDEEDDEFNLPISLALIMLMAYMMLGAWIFTFWEDWSFFEAFYFVFISMSTIGFGDYVPEHPMYMMATFIYLLFGLALTSMCINVIQEKLSATFNKAKLRLGTTIGLDMNAIMQEDMANGAPSKSEGDESKAPSRRGSKSVEGRRGSRNLLEDKDDKKKSKKDEEEKDKVTFRSDPNTLSP